MTVNKKLAGIFMQKFNLRLKNIQIFTNWLSTKNRRNGITLIV